MIVPSTRMSDFAHPFGLRPSIDIPILVYHHIRRDNEPPIEYSIGVRQFGAQMRLLHRLGYQSVSLDALFDSAHASIASRGKRVVVTFDDGYDSFCSNALPVLRKFDLTATLFLVAGEIGGVNRWDVACGMPELRLMDIAAIREVLGEGMEIGSHGWQHRDLTACTAAELREETLRSKRELENVFSVPVRTFAYPYGRFNQSAQCAVREAGYDGALSVFSDAPPATADPFAIPRIYVHEGDGALRFRAKISAAYSRLKAWRGRGGT